MRSCLLPPSNIYLNNFENLRICPSATMCNIHTNNFGELLDGEKLSSSTM
jgi:hypothetical protein